MTTMRQSENRTITQALVTFLFKLRSGNSDNCIGAILGIEEKQVSRFIDFVSKCFRDEILPKYFGIHAHSREFLMSNTAMIANKLHNLNNRLA